MNFIQKNENGEEFYSVDYDREMLKEILKKLKKYEYVKISQAQIAGDITNWPATEKIIKKRVASFFYKVISFRYENATLYPETIVHHTENGRDYVTYNFSYTKLPDLYSYIETILNNDYPTFRKNSESVGLKRDNAVYYYSKSDQLVLNGLLSYADSPELRKHDSINEGKEYDYEGLKELYKETLGCFKFNLVAVKEYLKEPKSVNVLSLRK